MFLLLFFLKGAAQSAFQAQKLSEGISLHRYAKFANAGQKKLSLKEVREGTAELDFQIFATSNPNIGFTSDQYWVKFRIKNNSKNHFNYFLETARPITDQVDFYSIDGSGDIIHQKSGDLIPFSTRSFNHRKTIFELQMSPGEHLEIYIRYQSDGEVLNLPLILYNASGLLNITYIEQLVFGIFFGILFIAAIIYMFFYFALRERSFLFYSLYVVSVALLQFSLDGFFHQYFGLWERWLPMPAVLLFAIISAGFLGRYAEVYLSIKQNSGFLHKIFLSIYFSLGALLVAVTFFPGVLEFAYPVVNILGLGVLMIILVSMAILFSKKVAVDKFFFTGIFFLVLGFVIFILNNLSLLPNTFLTRNSAKLGTGLEIIFLSLSMANRIKKLKSEKAKMQNLALIRLQEMNELKSYFLSNLSHELRTPLNSIMGLADSIANQAKDLKIKTISGTIKASSVRLLNLINDILDFSKIEKGELKLEKEAFDPKEVLEQLRLIYEKKAEEKGLIFEYEISDEFSDEVIGDSNRLSQILNNLLDNAVKFTPDGKIKVNLKFVPENNKISLIFKVSDSGIGIPPEKIDLIFESLTQESINNKRSYGGLGLGLFIVKVLVDMHYGDIQIHSTPGSGTTCDLKLSYFIASKIDKIGSGYPCDRYDLLGSQILVVEDDPINQMVLKMIMKDWKGTEISFVRNGAEALEKLKTTRTDLVLMDLQMPVMDGYEATIAIREGSAGPEYKDIPIIAVTADVTETTRLRVIEIGMDDYMAKPVNKDKLYKKMIALLAKVEMRKGSSKVPQ